MQAVNDALKLISQSLQMLDDLKVDVNLIALDDQKQVSLLDRVSVLLKQSVDILAA